MLSTILLEESIMTYEGICRDCKYKQWMAVPPRGKSTRCVQCGGILDYLHPPKKLPHTKMIVKFRPNKPSKKKPDNKQGSTGKPRKKKKGKKDKE